MLTEVLSNIVHWEQGKNRAETSCRKENLEACAKTEILSDERTLEKKRKESSLEEVYFDNFPNLRRESLHILLKRLL